MSGEDFDRYLEVPTVEVGAFQDSDHEIHTPDYERFMGTVGRFLLQSDS